MIIAGSCYYEWSSGRKKFTSQAVRATETPRSGCAGSRGRPDLRDRHRMLGGLAGVVQRRTVRFRQHGVGADDDPGIGGLETLQAGVPVTLNTGQWDTIDGLLRRMPQDGLGQRAYLAFKSGLANGKIRVR